MTEQPPAQPLPYEIPEKPERPGAITALATIGIVFGGLGIIGSLCGMAGILMVFAMQRSIPDAASNPTLQAMRDSRFFMIWTGVSLVIGWTLALVLLVGSIGALRLKQWARPILIYYAVIDLIFRGVALAVSFAVIKPLLKQATTSVQDMFGYAILAVQVAFPVLLLIFFTRPKIVAAFEARAGERI